MALLPVDAARERILAGVEPLPAELVALGDAAERVLATPLVADHDQPPFPASAMDGYAVRSADTGDGSRLRVVGESIAGRRFAGAIAPGEAVRIFTGAPVPDGADAILAQEDAERTGAMVTVRASVAAGRYVRPAGLDFRAGDSLLLPGRRLGPRELALAAAAGVERLPVRRQPRVAILELGDELVTPGTARNPDQINAACGDALAALVARCGAMAWRLPLARDQTEAVIGAAGAAQTRGADILLTVGGASVGDHDLVRPALAAVGMELAFWRIAMRPGRPLLYGRLGGMRVLGVPGNPVSALVCSLVFLRPLLDALLGRPAEDASRVAELGVDLPANDGREDYVRARTEPTADGRRVVIPLPRQDSSMLRTLAEADCLLIRAADAPPARAGDPCRILPLD